MAFSRILSDREVLIVANTGSARFTGTVVVDRDLNPAARRFDVAYSNRGTTGSGTVRWIDARFHRDGAVSLGPAAVIDLVLDASEAQVLAPLA